MLVFFAGEQPSFDNSMTAHNLNSPRNLAVVKVPTDLTDGRVLSPGPRETGGFYTFIGRWADQANVGVGWLTNNDDMSRNVCRPKTARLGKDRNLVAMEYWTGEDYIETACMLVDDSGNTLTAPTVVVRSGLFRLAPTDDLVVKGGDAISWHGSADGKLVRFRIRASSGGVGGDSVSRLPSAFPPPGVAGFRSQAGAGAAGSVGIGDPSSGGNGQQAAARCDQADYRGTLNTTKTGLQCQKWTAQQPRAHGRAPDQMPGKGLGDHNYCRNPDGRAASWCYTADPNTEWEYCDVRTADGDDGVYAHCDTAAAAAPTVCNERAAGWAGFVGEAVSPRSSTESRGGSSGRGGGGGGGGGTAAAVIIVMLLLLGAAFASARQHPPAQGSWRSPTRSDLLVCVTGTPRASFVACRAGAVLASDTIKHACAAVGVNRGGGRSGSASYNSHFGGSQGSGSSSSTGGTMPLVVSPIGPPHKASKPKSVFPCLPAHHASPFLLIGGACIMQSLSVDLRRMYHARGSVRGACSGSVRGACGGRVRGACGGSVRWVRVDVRAQRADRS
jgi:hypothetical protein